MAEPDIKVSVVVPVYNAGPNLEACARSILAQSLAPGEYEAIFVDDGSTDESPARLDELAAAHPNVRVIHQPNSGWPGKPRNVGIDAARGTYVYFVDHDDLLTPEALERLYEFAERTRSDVVLGKMAGLGRGAPRMVFAETRERATIEDSPIIGALTPHKLFRKAFLDEHGIRFPEGRRRLEDQVFVVRAYFAADVISIFADYTCYIHVAPGRGMSAASGRYDPAGRFDAPYYYRFLREVLDVVEANTEPGPIRDRILRRFVSRELLGRLSGPRFIAASPAGRRVLVDEIRGVVERYVPTSVDEDLQPLARTQMALVRSDRIDLLVALARLKNTVTLDARVREMRPLPGGSTAITVEGELVADHRPLVFERDDRGLLLPVPPPVADAVPQHVRRLQDPPGGRFHVALQRRRDGAQTIVSGNVAHRRVPSDGGVRLVHTVEIVLDPEMRLEGRPMGEDRFSVIARLYLAGYATEAPVRHRGSGRPGRLAVAGGRVTVRAMNRGVRRRVPIQLVTLGQTRAGRGIRRLVTSVAGRVRQLARRRRRRRTR